MKNLLQFEPQKDTFIAYYPNIERILIEDLDLIELPTNLKYFICGGYPTALLFHKRDFQNKLPKDSYGDIDFYFNTEEDAAIATKWAKATHNIIYETESAVTFKTNEKTIQFIKNRTGCVSEILSSFDLLNVCIGIDQKKKIYFHKDIFHCFSNKRLEINLHRCKDILEFEPKLALKVLQRMVKYSRRYDLSLSNNCKEMSKELKKLFTISDEDSEQQRTIKNKLNTEASIYKQALETEDYTGKNTIMFPIDIFKEIDSLEEKQFELNIIEPKPLIEPSKINQTKETENNRPYQEENIPW